MKRSPSPDPYAPMAIALEWSARIMAVALEMVLPGLAGVWLDRRFGTQCLAWLGFVFGLVAGMWHLIRVTKTTGGTARRRPPDDGPSRE